MTTPTLLSQRAYAAYRKAKGLYGATQGAVSQAISRGRIKYAPGTTLIDPVQADADWLQHTEPRPQFQPKVPNTLGTRQTDSDDYSDAATARARFAARQLEPVDPAHVLRGLNDAYRIMTAKYQALCAGLPSRTEMTVGDLDKLIDETLEQLDAALAQCIHLAFTGEVHR